jgi:HlyD family secretion protein
VPQKEAALHAAAIDVDRTTIRSPIDGVVVGRNVNEGQTLATTLEARTLFIIAGDLRRMEIHAKVDETDIGKIEVGQEAAFTVDAHPGRQFSATVRQIRKAPQVQQNVVTYTVVLATDNPDNLLLPGMTALVRITVSRTGQVLKIPLSALRFAPSGEVPRPVPPEAVVEGRPASIWVPGEDGTPKPVPIGVGEDDANQVAVLSGPLSEGDRVFVAELGGAPPRQLFGIRIGF